jgi:hypothetical protein
MIIASAALPEALKVELVKQSSAIDWGGSAPWLIALGALVFSVYQYRTTTRIKRLEYLDGLAKTMREEPLLKVATQMLDWEVRTIEFDEERYVYSVTMLGPALAVHSAPVFSPEISAVWKKGFNEIETLIRDAFDALFAFLENVQYAVDLKVATEEDIYNAPLAYYLRKLCEKDRWTSCAICRYLSAYGFPKTERMLKNYKTRYSPVIAAFSDEQILACQQGFEAETKEEEQRKARQVRNDSGKNDGVA